MGIRSRRECCVASAFIWCTNDCQLQLASVKFTSKSPLFLWFIGQFRSTKNILFCSAVTVIVFNIFSSVLLTKIIKKKLWVLFYIVSVHFNSICEISFLFMRLSQATLDAAASWIGGSKFSASRRRIDQQDDHPVEQIIEGYISRTNQY